MRIGELLKASAVPFNEKGGVLHRRQDQYPVAIFDRVLSGRYQVGEQFENRHLAFTFNPIQRDRAEYDSASSACAAKAVFGEALP